MYYNHVWNNVSHAGPLRGKQFEGKHGEEFFQAATGAMHDSGWILVLRWHNEVTMKHI